MSVRWDGKACRFAGDPPTKAGLTSVLLINETKAPVALLFGGATPPKTWADALSFVRHADLSNPNVVVPGWLVQVPGDVMADAGSTVTAFVTLPTGNLGALCATGTWPDLTFVDGGGFSIGG